MTNMHRGMLISLDRTGFPLIVIEGLGLEVHLLPVCKWQFEQFLKDAHEPNNAAYQEMLQLNPAIPLAELAELSPSKREQLFLSGVLPMEIRAFAEWLGEGFDLPTVKEWRAIYKALRRLPEPEHSLADEILDGVARDMVSWLSQTLRVVSMSDLALMQGGLVEWVKHEQRWLGLGSPRPDFHPNLWNPLDHSVRPHRLDMRLPYFGFRLVRRKTWTRENQGETRFIY